MSANLGEENFSDMMEEEEEMITYTARLRQMEKKQIQKIAKEQARKNIKEKTKTLISKTELEKHFSNNDAWIAIHGKVYDVTGYAKRHPGGNIIMSSAGKDGTKLFGEYILY